MKQSVLDSYALLAYLQGESSARTVQRLLKEAEAGKRQVSCCWVNIAEVLYVIARRVGAGKAADLLQLLEQLPLHFLPADRDISLRAAEIKRLHPLSLGDAFAAATALSQEAEVVTGDPEFHRLENALPILWLCP